MDPCVIPEGTPKDRVLQLQQLCACKKSSEQLKNLIEKNIEISKINESRNVNYMRDFDNFSRRHKEWEEKRGEYDSFSSIERNDRFQASECWGKPRGCLADPVIKNQATHDVCKRNAKERNLPYAEEYEDTGERIDQCKGFFDGCAGYGFQSWMCARPQDAIDSHLNRWGSSEPKNPAKPELELPIPVDNVDIQCCANYMDIGDRNINLVQSCQQQITRDAGMLLNNADPITPITPKITIVSENEKVGFEFTENKTTLIVIVIVTLLLLCMSSSMVVVYAS